MLCAARGCAFTWRVWACALQADLAACKMSGTVFSILANVDQFYQVRVRMAVGVRVCVCVCVRVCACVCVCNVARVLVLALALARRCQA
jgi:hypothetical protein